ncbi:flagellar hook-associated protein FlgK [Rhodopseudomonas palustris]|uniref:Flagellar hook-associated protein 1 n=1 Tax=Rhodopseudomonas palustris (strain BisB18) TaxID=316056 RepID=Q216W7_RHOPB
MLTTAFSTAVAGLEAAQKAIRVVSQNVGNAGTAGYVRRTVTTVASGPGNSSVAVGTVNRVFEDAALKQLRLEASGAAYSSTKSNVLSQLDKLFGKPGDATALDGRMNAFTQSLQGLATDPSSVASRSTVLNKAAALTERIRSLAGNVQELRSGIENRLGSDVGAANNLLKSIASLNAKLAATSDDSAQAGLLDQRDQQITQLSSYLDVKSMQQRDGAMTLMTTSGVVLVDRDAAATLSFDGRGNLGPTSAYSTDPSARGVGTITATLPGGAVIDLGVRGALSSGSIAAQLELRDVALPLAQRRLDDLAFGLAQSLTDKSAVGTQSAAGVDLNLADLASLKPGNTITIPISAGGAIRNVILVASSLASRPVDANQTIDANAQVQTFTIPAAPATARDYATAISAALSVVAPGLTAASTTSGKLTLSGAGIQGVVAISTQPKSAGDVSGAHPWIAMFVDGLGNALVTGSLDGAPQRTGLAQRLSVNAALIGDSSVLVAASRTSSSPNPSRPQFVYDALTSSKLAFSSVNGIGGTQAPHVATVAAFAQEIVAAQGSAAAAAKQIDDGQTVALGVAQGRFSKSAGVNIDEEMSRLMSLQTAYAANARVLSAVREMLDVLMKI